MKKIYIILLSIIGVISSCTKHEDIIDTSLQPGSILCSDGSIVHPSLFSPNEKEAIGVVFWCNDGNNPDIKETAYAVSLEDLEDLKSASNLNGNLNCSKELEHYAS